MLSLCFHGGFTEWQGLEQISVSARAFPQERPNRTGTFTELNSADEPMLLLLVLLMPLPQQQSGGSSCTRARAPAARRRFARSVASLCAPSDALEQMHALASAQSNSPSTSTSIYSLNARFVVARFSNRVCVRVYALVEIWCNGTRSERGIIVHHLLLMLLHIALYTKALGIRSGVCAAEWQANSSRPPHANAKDSASSARKTRDLLSGTLERRAKVRWSGGIIAVHGERMEKCWVESVHSVFSVSVSALCKIVDVHICGMLNWWQHKLFVRRNSKRVARLQETEAARCKKATTA